MKVSNKIKTTVIASLLGAVLAGSALARDVPISSANTVSLKDALLIAKQHTNAESIAAELEVEMGQSFYEITSINDQGEEINTVISASSGKVLSSQLDNDGDDEHDDNDDVLENIAWLSSVKNGSIKSLDDVIEAAEQAHDAKVYEVEFEDDHGFIKKQMVYELALVDVNGETTDIDVPARW